MITDSASNWRVGQGSNQAESPAGIWRDGCIREEDPGETFEPFLREFRYFGHIGGGLRFCASDPDTYPRVGQFTMAPHFADRAAKQWISDVTGPATLIVDAQRLQGGGDGQRLVVRKNGEPLLDHTFQNESLYLTDVIRVEVAEGDTFTAILSALEDQQADWTAVRLKLFDGHIDEYPENAALLTFDQSNQAPSGWLIADDEIGKRIVDESGRGNPAFALKEAECDRFFPGVRGSAMAFDGYRTPLILPAKNLGDQADQLTVSFWMNPHHYQFMESPAILSSSGDDFVAISLSNSDSGNSLRFRVQPREWEWPEDGSKEPSSFVTAPDNSTSFTRWQHVTMVWQSGSRQEIWTDGELIASNPDPVESTLSIEDWFIGKDHREPFAHRIYNGLLDEFFITPVALDPDEIQKRYRQNLDGANEATIADSAGSLIRERWTKLEGNTLIDLKRNSEFFDGPRKVESLASAHTGSYYATFSAERIRGYVLPPEDGFYRFWVAGRGEVELLLSSDDSKFQKRIIGSITRDGGQPKGASPNTSRPFDAFDSQASEAIYLRKGERYFVELLQASGIHSKNRNAIAWKTPSGDREFIPARFLAPYRASSDANDKDDDSLPDDWEGTFGLDSTDRGQRDLALQGEYGDFDGDELSNHLEFILGLDPTNSDTDGDGYLDGEEYHSLGSNPALKDRPAGELIDDIALDSFSSSDHDWITFGGSLISSHFRGGLTWDFSVEEAGPYFYDISLRLDGVRLSEVHIPLRVSIDGNLITSERVRFSGSHTRVWRVHGPPLAAGKHQLSLFIDNDRIRRTVSIRSVQVRRPEGKDVDGNGIPDWYEAFLYKDSGISELNERSRFSPAFVEGTAAQGTSAVRLNGSEVNSLGANQWYANVPLEPGVNAVAVSLPNGRLLNHSIEWQITNILENHSLSARVGDQILIGGYDQDGRIIPVNLQMPGGKGETESQVVENSFSYSFEKPGEYLFTGNVLGGEGQGSITVRVFDYELPDEIAVLTEWDRDLNLPALEEGLIINGSTGLLVRPTPDRGISGENVTLLSSQGGEHALTVRLADSKAIVSVARVPSILVSSALNQDASSTYASGAPEGYLRIHAPFVALYLPVGAYIELGLFRSGMMFDDGSNLKTLQSNDFTDGVCYVDFFLPRRMVGGYCHHLSVYDRHGTLLNTR